jgi:hypothetical protein
MVAQLVEHQIKKYFLAKSHRFESSPSLNLDSGKSFNNAARAEKDHSSCWYVTFS